MAKTTMFLFESNLEHVHNYVIGDTVVPLNNQICYGAIHDVGDELAVWGKVLAIHNCTGVVQISSFENGGLEMCSKIMCTEANHCSREEMKTLLVGLRGLSSPPTKIISPHSNFVAAAAARSTGRLLLDNLSHDLPLGEYL